MCVCVCVCARARACVCVQRARTQHSACTRANAEYASLFDSTSAHISVYLSTHTSHCTHTQHSCTNLTQDAAREDAKVQTLQPLSSKGEKKRRANAATQEERKCFSFEKSKNRRKHAPAHALQQGGMRHFVSRVDSLLAASSVSSSAALC